MHLSGLELKKLFESSFYCDGKHHSDMRALPIPTYLKALKIKDDNVYRIFYNDCFCRIMNNETDKEITFFGHRKSNFSRFYKLDGFEIPRCPSCDSEMDLRAGKYGLFWSCHKYPVCKGLLSIGIIKDN